jgi:hypothetical protein
VAETDPCFYGHVKIGEYPIVYVVNYDGRSESKGPKGPLFVIYGGPRAFAQNERLEDALAGPFHQAFPPDRFGPLDQDTYFEIKGRAHDEGLRMRAALKHCIDESPKYPSFLFQLDAKGEFDLKTYQGNVIRARECVRKTLSGLVFPCLSQFYVESSGQDMPY